MQLAGPYVMNGQATMNGIYQLVSAVDIGQSKMQAEINALKDTIAQQQKALADQQRTLTAILEAVKPTRVAATQIFR